MTSTARFSRPPLDEELLLAFARGGLAALHDWDGGHQPSRALVGGTEVDRAFLRGYRMTWAELQSRDRSPTLRSADVQF